MVIAACHPQSSLVGRTAPRLQALFSSRSRSSPFVPGGPAASRPHGVLRNLTQTYRDAGVVSAAAKDTEKEVRVFRFRCVLTRRCRSECPC